MAQWPSFAVDCTLEPDLLRLVAHNLDNLEQRHGAVFTAKALAYVEGGKGANA